ncbi:MAG: hypothetical protein ACRDON_08505 [Gaiellaceae bacterium]
MPERGFERLVLAQPRLRRLLLGDERRADQVAARVVDRRRLRGDRGRRKNEDGEPGEG